MLFAQKSADYSCYLLHSGISAQAVIHSAKSWSGLLPGIAIPAVFCEPHLTWKYVPCGVKKIFPSSAIVSKRSLLFKVEDMLTGWTLAISCETCARGYAFCKSYLRCWTFGRSAVLCIRALLSLFERKPSVRSWKWERLLLLVDMIQEFLSYSKWFYSLVYTVEVSGLYSVQKIDRMQTSCFVAHSLVLIFQSADWQFGSVEQ